MQRANRILVSISAVAAVLLLAGCIKIQTGPMSNEEATDAASIRAKDMEVNWRNRLIGATSIEKMDLTRTLIDTVTANFIRYGQSVADEWRKGSSARGQAVADSEMRAQVDRWNKTQRPIIQSYESMIEYAVGQIESLKIYDTEAMAALRECRDHFYQVYSGVFFPTGTIGDYEGRLRDLQSQGARLSDQLSQELRRYQ
jgi:hypothetical protein